MTDDRSKRIDEVREQVADGTYDDTNPEALQAVADGILADIPPRRGEIDGLTECVKGLLHICESHTQSIEGLRSRITLLEDNRNARN